MAKGDYFFPLYYQKLLTSTTGWKDEEFGAYVKLLIYQFDKGAIPKDIDSLVRIAPSLKKSWKMVSKKFIDNGAGELVNEVMDDIRNKRMKSAEINAKNGKGGGRPKNNPAGTQREPSGLLNGKRNETNNNMVNGYLSLGEEGSREETQNFEGVVPDLMIEFKKQHPTYPADVFSDFPALREIAKKIHKWIALPGNYDQYENRNAITHRWSELVSITAADDHYSSYSITRLNKHFQSIAQKFSKNMSHPVTEEIAGVQLTTREQHDRKIRDEIFYGTNKPK